MLEYDRIHISEKNDVVIFVIISILKILALIMNHKPYLCNCCHGLMQKAINFNDVAIVSIKESDYRIHF